MKISIWQTLGSEEQNTQLNWRKKKSMAVNIYENGMREKVKRVWELEKTKDEKRPLHSILQKGKSAVKEIIKKRKKRNKKKF